MKFWKYHGIGNDFILLDGSSGGVSVDADLCRRLCDRHYGIGADGVLYVLPGEGADVSMRIINADGSEAEMCGNGIRCVAKHVFDNGIVKKQKFKIRTQAGDLGAGVRLKDGKVQSVEVNMGAPVLDGRKVPIDHDGKFVDSDLEVGGRVIRGSAVSMGNPHFVTFSEIDEEDVRRLGPIIESHPFFPRRTNVEFCRVEGGSIFIKVYERGADWTLACGTGACASTVAAAVNGLVPFGEAVDVRLPGGWIRITVDKDLKRVLMEGPAELVFEGNIDTSSLEGS
ncbi:MAG: diaminopimelate epimerase [Candidatus Methanoplasma sp.]|jgi:diaminopimelate epimerase|nr:diaminopimelate epimerase [Candidatus Methanoplasma sp.]